MIEQLYADLLKDSFAAFAGAFFAFIFLRLAEALTAIYQRKVKHYQAS